MISANIAENADLPLAPGRSVAYNALHARTAVHKATSDCAVAIHRRGDSDLDAEGRVGHKLNMIEQVRMS